MSQAKPASVRLFFCLFFVARASYVPSETSFCPLVLSLVLRRQSFVATQLRRHSAGDTSGSAGDTSGSADVPVHAYGTAPPGLLLEMIVL